MLQCRKLAPLKEGHRIQPLSMQGSANYKPLAKQTGLLFKPPAKNWGGWCEKTVLKAAAKAK
jgi:hypothetical protein